MNMNKERYVGYLVNKGIEIPLCEEEFCTFITHFGLLDNLEIYDTEKKETILNTVGIFIESFYPDIEDRKLARDKALKYFDLFSDYKYQRKRKYPKGKLKSVYLSLIKLL